MHPQLLHSACIHWTFSKTSTTETYDPKSINTRKNTINTFSYTRQIAVLRPMGAE